jgi:hypothetical protein
MTSEDHSQQVRIASGINILLGIWLISSPWINGAATATAAGIAGATWNNVISGILIVLCSAIRFSSPQRSTAPSAANIVLGVWTLISPWIYGYTVDATRLRTNVIVGIAVIALAAWSGSATYQDHRRQRHA